MANDCSKFRVRGAGRILSSPGRVGGASSAEHPCPAEMALCNKQCHLLGGVGTMTLWAALHVFLKWWSCGFVWVGGFFLSNKCFKNQTTRSQKTVLMSGNASPHLESLIFF